MSFDQDRLTHYPGAIPQIEFLSRSYEMFRAKGFGGEEFKSRRECLLGAIEPFSQRGNSKIMADGARFQQLNWDAVWSRTRPRAYFDRVLCLYGGGGISGILFPLREYIPGAFQRGVQFIAFPLEAINYCKRMGPSKRKVWLTLCMPGQTATI